MQPQQSAHEPASTSFAGLLDALTTSRANAPHLQHLPNSFTDNLEDDVATLSYERALQNHSRFKSSGATFPNDTTSSLQHIPNSEELAQHHQPQQKTVFARKSTSVTIRISPDELVQLQLRAAEANLTISAYLRSCTFEAETLRAQVKQALADLRNSAATERRSAPTGSKWLRFLHHRKSIKAPE